MRTYSKKQIETFLLEVDKNLSEPFEIIVIGGTAAALGYEVTRFTKDIDTVNGINAIEEACENARRQTGFPIPFGPAGVQDGPCDYEDRLVDCSIPGLSKLLIRIPERHDLVLMKTVRGYAHDLETAAEIHKNSPLGEDTLIHLMKTEMTHVTGNKARILENFYALIETVFGEDRVERAQADLRNRAK